MAKIFITGSADGLGQLAAKDLIARGHSVVLHARSEARAREALEKVPGADTALAADLASLDETVRLAAEVNALGRFDAVIHNAAVYTAPGEQIFAINTLATYVLTCLIDRPERLIYMSSGMNDGGDAKLDAFKADPGRITYSDSKLHVVMLCKAVARRWPDVLANAVNPGWVPTKMGGPGATDSFEDGYETQVWLAVSDDPAAKVSGRYFYHQKEDPHNPRSNDESAQDELLRLCSEITGIALF